MAKTSASEAPKDSTKDQTDGVLTRSRGVGPVRNTGRVKKEQPYLRKQQTRRRTLSSENTYMKNMIRSPNGTAGQAGLPDEATAAQPPPQPQLSHQPLPQPRLPQQPLHQPQQANVSSGGQADPYSLLISKLDAISSNQVVTNTRIAELSGSVNYMNVRVTNNSAEIKNIQHDIATLKNRPVGNDRAVKLEVERQMAASKAVLDDQISLLVNKKND